MGYLKRNDILYMLKKIINAIKRKLARRNSSSYIHYLRRFGVRIGSKCVFRDPKTTCIDIQRPELISIGNNVDMNRNFTIMTHDYSSLVFRAKFKDFLNSTGRCSIGNNVYFGTNVTILKGGTIGDNCIIGAGSVVTKSIPSNSVAAGVPCRVICSLGEYYQKRKKLALDESVERVNCFIKRFGRDPMPGELREEFIYYVNKKNVSYYESVGVPIREQLAEAYSNWLELHDESQFDDFESFLAFCKKGKTDET